MQRSLYECFNARTKQNIIYCRKGHSFTDRGDGMMAILRLVRGEPLRLTICQDCADFDNMYEPSMGKPIMPKEKGWIKIAL